MRNIVTGEKFFLDHSEPLNVYTEKQAPIIVQTIESWMKTSDDISNCDIATVTTSMVEDSIDTLSNFITECHANINEQFAPYNIEQPVKFLFTDLIDVLYKSEEKKT